MIDSRHFVGLNKVALNSDIQSYVAMFNFVERNWAWIDSNASFQPYRDKQGMARKCMY